MKTFSKAVIAIATLLQMTAATTVTLQDGIDGYEGCRDMTIFSDYFKAEKYSWYENGKYKGYCDDPDLVNATFKC